MGKYGSRLVRRVSIALVILCFVFFAMPAGVVASSVVNVYGNYMMNAAVMSDGTVWAWGNKNPVPEHVAGLTGIKSVVPRFYGDYIALKEDGTVWVWKYGSPAAQVQGLTGVKKVITLGNGPDTGYALKNDGTIWRFISKETVYEPVQVKGLENVKDFTRNTLLKNDGTVWKWGILPIESPREYFEDGQVVRIDGLSNVDSILYDGLVVKNDGTIWEWGGHELGENNTLPKLLTPWQVPINISDVKKITERESFFTALKNDGTVWTWGFGAYIGDNSVDIFKVPSHTLINTGFSDVIDIASGGYGTIIALKSDGTVWAMGEGGVGQLGMDSLTTIAESRVPVQVPGLKGVKSVYLTELTCYALKDDGSLWAWGANDYGQLGDGTLDDKKLNRGNRYKPVKVLIESSSASTPALTITPGASVVPCSTVSASLNPGFSLSPSAQASSSGTVPILGNGLFGPFLALLGIAVIAGGAAYLFRKY